MTDFGDYYKDVAAKAREDRSKLRQEEAELLANLARVRTQIGALGQVVQGIEKVMQPTPAAGAVADLTDEEPEPVVEWDGGALDDAAVGTLRKQGPMKASELLKALRSRGYKPTAKSPVAALKRRLLKLVKGERLTEEDNVFSVPRDALYGSAGGPVGAKHQGKISISPSQRGGKRGA